MNGEVIPSTLEKETRRQIVQLSIETGIDVIAIGASTRFAFRDGDARQRNERELLQYLELAADMEVPIVRTFGTYTEEGLTAKEAISYVAESLAKVAPRAEQLGISVLLETHDDFSNSALVREVVSCVNSPAIGVPVGHTPSIPVR